VITSKQLIIASVALLAASAVLGLINLQKTRGLRTEVVSSEMARQNAEQQRASREKLLKDREAAVAAASAKYGDTQNKVASTEAELAKVQAEKNDLQAKLHANETEIADLRKRIEGVQSNPAPNTAPATSTAELQAQLEDAKKQLDAAEREKILLSDKMKVTQEKSSQLETEKKQHRPVSG
jgi:chromosome segregation ATPase